MRNALDYQMFLLCLDEIGKLMAAEFPINSYILAKRMNEPHLKIVHLRETFSSLTRIINDHNHLIGRERLKGGKATCYVTAPPMVPDDIEKPSQKIAAKALASYPEFTQFLKVLRGKQNPSSALHRNSKPEGGFKTITVGEDLLLQALQTR